MKKRRAEKTTRSISTLMLCGVMANFAVGNPAMSHPDRNVGQAGGPWATRGTSVTEIPGNLTSTSSSVSAGALGNFNPVNVLVGKSVMSVNSNSMLTPAEFLATQQVLNTGHQSLILGADGNAIGGRLTLSNSLLLADLVVPKGVVVQNRITNALQSLSIAGILQNSGNLNFLSSLAGPVSAVVQAASIENLATGVISASQNINLSLIGLNGITNYGVIAANNNLSLTAPSIVNQGTVSSAVGNINLLSTGANLNVTGAGTFQALLGNINVATAANAVNPNITMLGSSYLSQQLNINAPGGNLLGNLNDVTGLVNITACNNTFGASTANLRFGDLNISGDPTYFNTSGNLTLSNVPATGGQALALLASGNVVVSAGSLDTHYVGTTGDGGDLLIVAGANLIATPPLSGQVNNDTTTTVTFSGASATGGSINLNGVTTINTTGTSDGTATANGGNVTMLAFKQNTGTGTINLGTSIINTYGNGLGTGGDVLILAGATANPSGGQAIFGTGRVDSTATPPSQTFINTGGSGTVGSYVGGNVTIATATPNISSLITVLDGAIQPGSGTISQGTIQPTSMLLGPINTSPESPKTLVTTGGPPPSAPNAGNVTLTSGNTISVGPILAIGLYGLTNTVGQAGQGGSGGNVSVQAAGNISISQIITSGYDGGLGNTGAGGQGGNGGNVLVNSDTGNVTINTAGAGAILANGGAGQVGAGAGDAGGAGGNAGSVTVTAPLGTITLGAIEASGGGGAGGNGGGLLGGAGGAGGSGGNVLISAFNTATINGYISAAAGGGGGAGGAGPDGAGGGGGGSTFASGFGGNAPGGTAGGGGAGGGAYPNSGGSSGNTAGGSYDALTFTGGTGANGTNGSGGKGGVFTQGGLGGSSFVIGGDGGGAGGSVGNIGAANAGATASGGASGNGGNISLSGTSVAVKGTFLTVYQSIDAKTKTALQSAPHSGDSLFTAGPLGTIAVTTYGTSSTVATPQYGQDSNLSSAVADGKVQLKVTGAPFAVGSNTTNGTIGVVESGNANFINNTTTSSTVTKASFNDVGRLSITENGNLVSFSNGDLATPAEIVALTQVSGKTSSSQTLTLNATGVATGGSFNIATTNIPSTGFSNLTIPAGVAATSAATAITVKASSDSSLASRDGAYVNNGTFNFSTSGTITATSITGTGTLGTGTTGTLTLNATNGDIAQSPSSNLDFNTSTANLSATATGNVLVNNTQPGSTTSLNLINGLAANGLFRVTNSNTINAKGSIAGSSVTLVALGTGGVNVSGNILAPNGTLTIGTTSGAVNQSAAASTISADTLSLLTGTSIVTLGKTGQLFANNFTANSNGSVSIIDAAPVNLGASTTTANFSLTAPQINVTNNSSFGSTNSSILLVTPNLNFENNSTITISNGSGNNLVIQAPSGRSLTFTGDGSITSPLGVTVSAAGQRIAFDSSNVQFNVNALSNVTFTAGPAFDISSDSSVNVNSGSAVVNSSTVFNPGGLTADTNVTFNITPTIGTSGLITNTGDIILGKNTLVNTSGLNLAIIAGGSVGASGITTINTSNTKGNGGDVTILAGVTFTRTTVTAQGGDLVQVTGQSASGGNVNLASVSINTSSTAATGSGGNIFIAANDVASNPGTVYTGALTTSGKVAGGNVQIIAPGGINVNGAVTTTGATQSGSVNLATSTATLTGIQVINGVLRPTSTAPYTAPTASTGAAVNVTGLINTSATGTGFGGNVNVVAADNVTLTAGVNTTSKYVSGDFSVLSAGGNVNINSNVNTAGVNATTNVVAGSGGDVSVVGAAFVNVLGNITTNGGVAKGTSISGNAGSVNLSTSSSDNTNGYLTGNVFVKGYINASGGTQSGTGNGFGGNAGAVTISGGAYQVTGTLTVNSQKASIINSNGTGTFVSGTAAPVTLTSYSVQALPSNFDLTSTTKNISALPGAQTDIGVATVVNGTAGAIINGSAIVNSSNGSGLVGGDTIYNYGGSTGVTINLNGGSTTNGGSQDILLPSAVPTTLTIAPRTLVTPAMAVALYQTSLGGGTSAQTVGLNTAGQATDVNPQAAGGSLITAPSYDLPSTFTAFNLTAQGTASNIKLSVTGAAPILNVPSKAVISGSIDFPTTGTVGVINFGANAFTVAANSTIGASGGSLGLQGSGAITNNGTLSALNSIILLNPAKAVTLKNQSTISADLVLPTTGAPASLTYTNTGAFTGEVDFQAVQLPTAYSNSQALNPSSAQQASVALTLTSPSAVNLGGTIPTGSIGTLTVTGKAVSTTVPTSLNINSANWTLGKGLTISTGGDLIVTTSTLNAGTGAFSATAGNTLTLGGTVNATTGITVTQTTLSNSNILTVGSLDSGGKINVIGNGALIKIADNAHINAHSSVASQKATILIQNKNTAAGIAKIEFGASSLVETSGAGGSTIDVAIGPTKGNVGALTTSFTNVTVVNTNGGQVYGGQNTGALVGTGPTNAVLTAKGTQLRFQSPNNANTITFDSNAQITADPPASVLKAATPVSSSVQIKPMEAGVISKGHTITNSSNPLSSFVNSVFAPTNIESRASVMNSPLQGHADLSDATANTFQIGGTQFKLSALKAVGKSDFSVAKIAEHNAIESPGKERIAHVYAQGSTGLHGIYSNHSSDRRGHVLSLQAGELFLNPLTEMSICTKFGTVILKKGALASLSVDNSSLKVVACSGPGDVSINVEGKEIAVEIGSEIVISNSKGVIAKADGIGRRNQSSQKTVNGLYISGSEISLVSMLASNKHLHSLVRPTTNADRQIAGRFLKTAAAIQQITGRRGIYRAN